MVEMGRSFRRIGTAFRAACNYLMLNEIEHRNSKIRQPETSGFVERFDRAVLAGYALCSPAKDAHLVAVRKGVWYGKTHPTFVEVLALA